MVSPFLELCPFNYAHLYNIELGLAILKHYYELASKSKINFNSEEEKLRYTYIGYNGGQPVQNIILNNYGKSIEEIQKKINKEFGFVKDKTTLKYARDIYGKLIPNFHVQLLFDKAENFLKKLK